MASSRQGPGQGHTAVIDIGKSHGRLVVLAADGECLYDTGWDSGACSSGLGYDALDMAGTEAQLRAGLAGLGGLAASLQSIIVAAHGAAVAALQGKGLAFPVPDYEWPGFEQRPASLAQELDPFAQTLSPTLPRGLNMGMQLDWLDRQGLLARADTLLPYAQYWAWWLSGVAASEASSLGCHTLLWQPLKGRFSHWAQARGWADKFAPLHKAWAPLGPIRPDLADELRLPRSVTVHAGAHDSNACLARYLRGWPRMTLVSSGTWFVVMAPGVSAASLQADADQFANVSVRGEAVATARFMGGRELETLCAGADPAQADPRLLPSLLARGLQVLPGFEAQGGPYAARPGELHVDGQRLDIDAWRRQLSLAERATAASLYAAQMTACLIDDLGALGPVVIEGPLAGNAVALGVLAALLPDRELHLSAERIEGTVLGSWALTRWTEPVVLPPRLRPVMAAGVQPELVRRHHAQWRAALA